MATLIPTQGRVQSITLPTTGEPSLRLRTVQELIGGYIELLPLSGGSVLILDEDGRSKQLPINLIASQLANRQIVGTVLLCSPAELRAWDN